MKSIIFKMPSWKGLSVNLQILNFDVILAGFFACLFASQICNVELDWIHYCILCGSIWSIYTTDHLLDSIRAGAKSDQPKRVFHLKHFTALSIILALTIAILFYLSVNYLNARVWLFGLLLFSLCIIHLLLSQMKIFQYYTKEIVIAIIFCMGVWLLPISLQKQINLWPMILAFIHLWLCVFMNLIAISIFERKQDLKHEFISFVQFLGIKKSIQILKFSVLFITIVSFVLLYLQWNLNNITLTFILILIGAWPSIMVMNFKFFSKEQKYLFYSDKIFWLFLFPAILWK